jgi:Gpi18-like mannosyltransferase
MILQNNTRLEGAMKSSVFRYFKMNSLRAMLVLACAVMVASVQSPLSAAEKKGTNYLQNGGAENIDSNGMPMFWRSDAWQGGSFIGKSNEKVHSGKYSILVESSNGNDARAVQTITVKPDTVYRLSGWIYAENVKGENSGANLCLLNTGFNSGFFTASQWMRAELVFKTHKNQTTVDVVARLGFYNATVTGRAFFDDISVEEVKDSGVQFSQLQESDPVSKSTAAGSDQQSTGYHLLVVLFYILVLAFLSMSFSGTGVSALSRIKPWQAALFLVAISAAVRFPLIAETPFRTDFDCFKAWSARMADIGPLGFYETGYFCDYPPFALMILWPFGLIVKFAGLDGSEFMYDLVLKMPTFLCDLGTAWLIYRLLEKKGTLLAFVCALMYAVLPPVIYDSGYWGQVDSIYTMMIVGVFYLILHDRPVLSGVILAAAFFTKTQTIAFVPAICCVYFVKYPIKRIAVSAGVALLFSVMLLIPFYVHHPLSDVFDFYIKQAGSYQDISINAGNFMSLVFGNMSPDSLKVLGFLPVRYVGVFLFAAGAALSCFLYLRKKDEESAALAFFLSAFCFFMFFPRVHERYLFAAFPFLVISAGLLKDRVLFFGGAILSVAFLINLRCVLLKYNNPPLIIDAEFERSIYIVALVSLAVLFLSALRAFFYYDSERARKMSAFFADFFSGMKKVTAEAMRGKPFSLTRRDAALFAGLLILYTCFIFFRLGSTETPQTGYLFNRPGNIIELTFPANSNIDTIVWFDAEDSGKVAIEKESGGVWEPVTMLDAKDYYVIKRVPVKVGVVTKMRLAPSPTAGMINEIAFLDGKGNPVTPLTVTELFGNRTFTPSSHPLFDEQSRVLAHSTHMNNTYFDEIYHGRTAYEFIKGYPVYEWTHPQLGKIVLMPGIKMFGMTHFGMRFMHAVMGVLFIGVLFFFGREVFSTRFGAFGVMLAGMLDFMPFAQSRYSTIDTTSVLLITLMLLFAVRYIKLESAGTALRRKITGIVPVLVFFALAAAVKWTAVYAFAGVCVCLLIVKTGQIIERRKEGGEALSEYMKRDFLPVAGSWLILFALIVPILYYVPYYFYVKSLGVKEFFSSDALNAVLKNQKDMFAYHSNLTEPHSYSSRFWGWPFDFKPLFLYQMSAPPAGLKSSIVSFGNPVIWWSGLVGIFVLTYRFIADRKFTIVHYCLIVYICLYIPWSFVTRAAFIYHYYPMLPLLYLFLVNLLESLWSGGPDKRRFVFIFIVIALFLLCLFYPVLSGMEIPDWYNNMLKWYPKDWWWS